jgi:hypothetical protein
MFQWGNNNCNYLKYGTDSKAENSLKMVLFTTTDH